MLEPQSWFIFSEEKFFNNLFDDLSEILPTNDDKINSNYNFTLSSPSTVLRTDLNTIVTATLDSHLEYFSSINLVDVWVGDDVSDYVAKLINRTKDISSNSINAYIHLSANYSFKKDYTKDDAISSIGLEKKNNEIIITIKFKNTIRPSYSVGQKVQGFQVKLSVVFLFMEALTFKVCYCMAQLELPPLKNGKRKRQEPELPKYFKKYLPHSINVQDESLLQKSKRYDIEVTKLHPVSWPAYDLLYEEKRNACVIVIGNKLPTGISVYFNGVKLRAENNNCFFIPPIKMFLNSIPDPMSLYSMGHIIVNVKYFDKNGQIYSKENASTFTYTMDSIGYAYASSLNQFCSAKPQYAAQMYIPGMSSLIPPMTIPKNTPQLPTKRTLLHYTASFGMEKETEDILRIGQDANSRDINGCTPLHIAVLTGNLRIVQLLINYGACFFLRNKEKYSPLKIATLLNKKKIIKLLLETPSHSSEKGFLNINRISELWTQENKRIIWKKDSLPFLPDAIRQICNLLMNNGYTTRNKETKTFTTDFRHLERLKNIWYSYTKLPKRFLQCVLAFLDNRSVSSYKSVCKEWTNALSRVSARDASKIIL